MAESLIKKESTKVEAKIKTTNVMGVELATYDGEKWFVRNIEQRKNVGIFGTYTLEEWKGILNKTKKKAF